MRRAPVSVAALLALCLTALLAGCAHVESRSETLPFPAPFPPVPAPPPPPATRGAVRAEIYRWFAAQGYRPFQAAALVDHAGIESGFHPCIAGAAGLRYTYQWGGRRLRRLHRFAGTRRCPPLDKQLAFADHELRSQPNFACFWRATTEDGALAALRRGFGRGRC